MNRSVSLLCLFDFTKQLKTPCKNRNSVNLQSRTMTWLQVHVVFLLCLSSFLVTTRAQQPYVGTATTDCSVADNSTSVLGYTCNGLNKTCLSYIIFRSRPPFSTVSTVSSLFSADPSLVSSLNSATNSTSFPLDQQLIVPVTCSCSRDNYSQSDITYTIQQDDSYFSVANNTFQGLSTCQAIGNQNNVSSQALLPGMRIIVPIRCACPTDKQVDQGVNYLLSYTVVFGDTVDIISQRFGVETSKTIEANEMTLENPLVFPFTTILIPLENPPSNSNTLLPSPPPPPQPPSASPPPPQSPGSGNSKRIWVYVLVGALVLLCILGVIIFCLVKRKSKKKEEPEISNTGNQSFTASKSPILDKDFDPLDGLSGIVAESLKVYKFQELKSATDDFNSLGESGYIGKINGDGAVIKKIEGDASNEINLLSKLNHFNIIRLSGFCFHEGDWYLVYEHASNGSLSDWIYTNSGNFLLSWIQRLQICVDIATGLNYLHNFADPPYVHKDINSNNVLLDIEFRGKIGNLGLARSTEGGEKEDFVLTKHVEGTKGYLAPEYLEHGLVSTKLDVYAFGVLMLEIVTGKEAYEMKKEIEEGTAMEVEEERYEFWMKKLGSCFSGNCPDGLESFVVKLVIDCLKRDHLSRPSMDEIVRTLSKILTASQSWDSSY